jgi:cyclophilin family peptidyl-prolyl cis-trans isomerase/HEAT repeat protein
MRGLRRASKAAAVVAGVLSAALLGGPASQRPNLLARGAMAPAIQTSGPSSGLLGVLAIEDARAPFPDDLRALLSLARSNNVVVQRAAVRALGRLERRDVVTDLLEFLHARDAEVQEEAASALLLAMRGEPLPGVAADQQIQTVFEALSGSGGIDSSFRALGRLPYTTAGQFRQAERQLAAGISSRTTPRVAVLRGLESLARLNRKLLPFEEATTESLRAVVVGRGRSYTPEIRRNALAALAASQGADTNTLATALKDDEPEVRRLAVLALAGAGSAIDGTRGLELLRDALSDRSPMVRLEAVKGWVRRAVPEQGCALVMSALSDREPIVFLYAMDALGEQCKDDILVTDRLTAEARSPAAMGAWHREAHALVSLAKRAPDRATLAMTGFANHTRWPIRMYAARAAGLMNDMSSLNRFALDEEDNVREAALPALRRLLGAGSDEAFAAALGRSDYQLLRTAARELKGAQPSQSLANALGAALERVTAEKKETSRDIRVAIIERLEEVGSERDAPWLRPLVRDFDPVIASAAARLLKTWSGEELVVDPQLLPRLPLPATNELEEALQAVVTMESGRTFTLHFETAQAPLARTRFLRLARGKYYDGLTFHRVVANAFVQGGSPGANEYAGDRLYMRDELGTEMHTRGSVGISTRGRDTGDAQIFINLVDNPFLDYEYTVFARVCGSGMETVDGIQEADRIRRVQVEPLGDCR